jgi:hypothetical protein
MGMNSPKTKTPRKIAREFPPLPEIDHFLTNPAGFWLFFDQFAPKCDVFCHFWAFSVTFGCSTHVPRYPWDSHGIAVG